MPGKTSQGRGALNKRITQIHFFPLGGDRSTSSKHRGKDHSSEGKSSILVSRAGCFLACSLSPSRKLSADSEASHLSRAEHIGRELSNQIPIHWAFAHLRVRPPCFPPPIRLGKQETASERSWATLLVHPYSSGDRKRLRGGKFSFALDLVDMRASGSEREVTARSFPIPILTNPVPMG